MEKLQLSESYQEIIKYKRNSHSVGVSMYHLEWCTKYRYKMFGKLKYKNLITACLRQAANKNKIKLIELGVEPEHVHCIVEFRFSITVARVLQLLKGISARLFFQFAEKTRLRYPGGHLWSRGNFASSVGFVQLDVVKEYVKKQSEHHGTVFIE